MHIRGRPEETLDLLQRSIDIASDAVFWMDSSARFIYVNQSACDSVGFTRDELLKMTLFDINPESTREDMRKLLEHLRSVKTVRLEMTHRRRDGSFFPVEIVSTLVVHGGREYINGFARDISQRKRAEADLHKWVAALSALQTTVLEITAPHELSPLLQTIVERAVRLLHADGGCLYLCDSKSREARCVVSFNTPRDYVGTRLKYGEGAAGVAAQTGKPLLIDDYFAWPGHARYDGEKTLAAMVTVPMLWRGEVTGVIDLMRFRHNTPFSRADLELLTLLTNHAAIATENARLRDGLQQELSERKRAEKERLDLQRRILAAQKLEGLGLLAGGVAHDFNNTLAVILGCAEMLKTGQASESDARGYLEEIIDAAGHSRDMTRKLLAIGRRQSLEMKPLNLNDVILGSESILRRTVRESIVLDLRLAPSPPFILADAGQIEQVILNLAANAQDAMPHGGRLRIETSELLIDEAYAKSKGDVAPGRHVRLAVSDTGVGMDREILERVFEPFFTTKAEGMGTGLGLSTVYGIVKQHGGSIDVQSETAQGTCFVIYFPATEVPLSHADRVEPSFGAIGEETVLVVEDQDQVRKLVCQHLRSLGYAVLEAKDGTSALHLASGYDGVVHLLVSDVVLEGMNGRELYDRLADERPGIKVLFMSGYAKDILSRHGVSGEGGALIQKPFTHQVFASRVHDVLHRGP
ncbi:MAG: ATP-binding protein [Spirochaetia bacterium]|jgi:PAS domain S-box-containing protein